METLPSTFTDAGVVQDQNKSIVREFFAAVDNQDFGKLNELVENDLRSMEVNHKTAVDKKDIEGILQFYAEDLINISQGEPILYGREQLKNLLVEMFKTYDLHEDFKFVDIRVIGECVAASYTFEQKMAPLSGGDMINRTGKGLCILKRSELGNWQFQWNSYSYDDMPEAGNGQTTAADIEKEKAAVSEKLDQWFRAIDMKDAEMLEDTICDDAELVFFGTDAQERWIGKDDFMAAQKEFFKATSDSRMEIYNKTVQLSQSGTVAWTSCMANWDILSGDQPMHLEGLRLTFTFEKRDGRWVIVQGHGSVPVSGQMIAY